MKSSLLSLAGLVLVASAATACGSAASDTSGHGTTTAGASTTASVTPAAAKASTTDSAAYKKAVAAWKDAAEAPMATVNTDIQRAADALQGEPSYAKEVKELSYLAGLPASGLTDDQVAQAHTDTVDLDTFFGTPGLMAGSSQAGEASDDSAAASPAASSAASSPRQSVGPCSTEDLRFTVSEESQAGGFYLITATAKPGVSCALKGITAAVSFGSSADSTAHPAEQAVSGTIQLSGSKKAYAGVNPKSGNGNGGVEYQQIIVSASNGDPDPVSLSLPSAAVVDQPVATNWHANAADAVPLS